MIITNRPSRAQYVASALCLASLCLCVSGCGNQSEREPAPQTRDTLSVASDKLSVTYDTLRDARDGRTYKTVTIGGRTWMAENLGYKTSDSSWCYDHNGSNCAKYGRLYAWNAATEACPPGWRLPAHYEWDDLSRTVGGKRKYYAHNGKRRGRDYEDNLIFWDGAGAKLKAKNGWVAYQGENRNGSDDYGFSALPGGDRSGSSFGFAGHDGYWWTATERNGNLAYSRHIGHDSSVIEGNRYKSDGVSVRCVRDGAAAPDVFLLTLKTATGGTVSGNYKKSYLAGEQVSIAASPDSGYVFVNWTGGRTANDTAATTTVTVDSNMAVTARFRAAPPIAYGAFTDKRDGKIYTTVKIGGKVWMAQNLNYKTDSSWCYKNNNSNCDKYGRLYAWNAATAACPSGWHLSNKDDWDGLCRSAGGKSVSNGNSAFNCEDAGAKLKSKTGWEKQSCAEDGCADGIPGKDNFGFSALPGGGYYDDNFYDAGYIGIWWTPIGHPNGDILYNSDTYYRIMIYDRDNVDEDYEEHDKADGLSARCVRNN